MCTILYLLVIQPLRLLYSYNKCQIKLVLPMLNVLFIPIGIFVDGILILLTLMSSSIIILQFF